MQKRNVKVFHVSICSMALILISCMQTNPEEKHKASSAKIRVVPVVRPTLANALLKNIAGSTAKSLQSFQIPIGSIFLAKDLEVHSSGFANPTGQLDLYNGPEYQVTAANALDAASDPSYIEFMSPSSLARLSAGGSFTSKQLGDYKFGVISWQTFIRIKTAIPLANGDTIFSKAGTFDSKNGPTKTVASTSMFTGPAETAIVLKNNGGQYFRFLKPITLTDADLNPTHLVHDTSRLDSNGHGIDTLVAAGQLSILLVFNPEDLVRGWDMPEVGVTFQNPGDIIGPDGKGNLSIPYLDATAVPYRQGEDVFRETYLFTGENPNIIGQSIRTRVEIYTVGDNIVAVSVRGLIGKNGEDPWVTSNIYFVNSSADGTLVAEDPDHKAAISGFHRLTEIGSKGTGSINYGYFTVEEMSCTLIEKRKIN
jgi:hypothetical protein